MIGEMGRNIVKRTHKKVINQNQVVSAKKLYSVKLY